MHKLLVHAQLIPCKLQAVQWNNDVWKAQINETFYFFYAITIIKY